MLCKAEKQSRTWDSVKYFPKEIRKKYKLGEYYTESDNNLSMVAEELENYREKKE